MKIVIAADSFKGSATSLQVANAIEKGLKRADKNVNVIKVAIADGGEGTMAALVLARNGFYEEVLVLNPLGKKIIAKYGVLDNDSVIIEMASASGLTLLKSNEYAPLDTTTYGVGQLINAALDKGYRNIYMGLGGSATNDGGAGMALALGVLLLNENDELVAFNNMGLKDIHKIDILGINPLVKNAKFTILSDVDNPLIGKDGAAQIFAPQKGANRTQVEMIENNLNHFANKILKYLDIDVKYIPGAGAAGGLGAGLVAFCNASISKGSDVILELVNLEQKLVDADIVISGEGKIDGQTIYGKAPIGVAKMAKKHDILTVAIVGSTGYGYEKSYDYGIDIIIDIIDTPMSLEAAINNTDLLIEKAAFNFYKGYLNSHKVRNK